MAINIIIANALDLFLLNGDRMTICNTLLIKIIFYLFFYIYLYMITNNNIYLCFNYPWTDPLNSF